MTAYTLTRSKRKTIALYICNGSIEVRAPLKCPKSVIDRFVAEKESWIKSKLTLSGARTKQRESFCLTYGSMVIYRGKQYPIAAKNGSHIGFDGQSFYMPPGLDAKQIKSACIQIYRMLAKRDITEKALACAKQMSVTPAAIKINGAKTRWGSCSSKKSLNFSWRLIMAEDDVIEYVVVHELAHITEMNHSTQFWAIVERILPDYQVRRKQLKKLQHRLNGEDWEE